MPPIGRFGPSGQGGQGGQGNWPTPPEREMKKEIRSATVDDFVNSSTTSCPKSRLYCGDTLCHRFRPLYHKFDHLTFHSHLFKVRSPDTLCHRFRPVYHKFHHLDHHSHLFKVRSPLWRHTLSQIPSSLSRIPPALPQLEFNTGARPWCRWMEGRARSRNSTESCRLKQTESSVV